MAEGYTWYLSLFLHRHTRGTCDKYQINFASAQFQIYKCSSFNIINWISFNKFEI